MSRLLAALRWAWCVLRHRRAWVLLESEAENDDGLPVERHVCTTCHSLREVAR